MTRAKDRIYRIERREEMNKTNFFRASAEDFESGQRTVGSGETGGCVLEKLRFVRRSTNVPRFSMWRSVSVASEESELIQDRINRIERRKK